MTSDNLNISVVRYMMVEAGNGQFKNIKSLKFTNIIFLQHFNNIYSPIETIAALQEPTYLVGWRWQVGPGMRHVPKWMIEWLTTPQHKTHVSLILYK